MRAKRRLPTATDLGAMSTAELEQVLFFANIYTGDSLTYTATPDDQERARVILQSRGYFGGQP